MRILHAADFHLGRTTHSTPGTTSRSDDYAATLMRFADVAVEERVHAALLAGDSFHTRRPTPRDLFAFTNAIKRLREGGVDTFISPGNHDGMDTVGDERTHALAWMKAIQPSGVHLLTSPTHSLVPLASRTGSQFNLVSIPYPHKRSFDAIMPDASAEERIEAISLKLEGAIETMRESMSDNVSIPTIFLGHVSVIGAALGSETTMRFGWDVTVRSGIFDKFDYAALGHIHRQQQVGDKAWYAGSPEYMDFGEIGQPKGFMLVDVEHGKEPKVEVIDSHPRPMVKVDMRQQDGIWVPSDDIPKGAIVDVSIYPDETTSPGEVLSLVRGIRKDGASYVKHRVVTPEQETARAAVDAEVSVAEALRRWLAVNGYEEEPFMSLGLELINEIGATA